MRRVDWIIVFMVVCRFAVAFVADSQLTDSIRPKEKRHVSGRPCLDKYRRLGTHSACLRPSPDNVPLDLTAQDIKLIVDTHNRYRSGVNPPATNMLKMSWDDEIAMIAQAWAETCSFKHDHSKNRDIPGRLSLGQNLAENFQSWTSVINGWFEEAKDFTFGEETNSLYETGHYTQGVWADTNKLGCGAARCGYVNFYVCNYGPAHHCCATTAALQHCEKRAKGNTGPINKPYENGQSCAQCPFHCESNLCACGELVCENGAIMDRNFCQCQCQHPWLMGRECKLNCSAVNEPIYCGRPPFDREGCDLYQNVPHDCPKTCESCPYGDGRYKEGTIPLPNSDNNNNVSDGGDNTSVGSSVLPQHLPVVLSLGLWILVLCAL